MRRELFAVLVLMTILTPITSLQGQTIYWKKDHVYAGPGGSEIAIITPPTTDTTAPTAPSITSATPSVASGYPSVALVWSASTDSGGSTLAGYKVYRKIGSGANLPVGTVGPSTLSFTDEPLKGGITYTYTIVAFDKAQNHSSPSGGSNVTGSSDSTAPSAPTGMAIAYTSATSVSMTWTASTDTGGAGMKGYRVYRDGALITPLVPAATRMFVNSSLAANTPYTYEVRGVDNAGNEGTGISRTVFRDDFNRSAGTGLNSPYWATSGSWVISSNQAYFPTGSASGNDTLTTKSFGSFTGSVITTVRGIGSNTSTSSGMVFWSNDTGTEKYVVNSAAVGYGMSLQYVTPSQTTTLATNSVAVYPPYMLTVDANATTREIKIYVNGIAKMTHTASGTYRNSGRVGMRATLYTGENVKTDDFIVVEKDESITSTDIVPANVRLTYLSTTSVQADWDASVDIGTGMVGYEVYRGSTLVSGGSPITPKTFQNTGLTANTAYTYTVKSVDTPGTRYSSLTKSIFRDDLNRTGSFLANAGWSSNTSWTLSGTAAQIGFADPVSGTALTAASFGSFRVTATLAATTTDYVSGTAGIVFWNNGTTGYRIDSTGLWYGATQVFAGGAGTGVMRVEANSATRTINVYVNNVLQVSYVETDTSRSNSGKVGITGQGGYVSQQASEYCYSNPDPACSGVVTADDFIVEEQ